MSFGYVLSFSCLNPFCLFGCTTFGILVPQPGTEAVPPAVEPQSINHCTSREVPRILSDWVIFRYKDILLFSLDLFVRWWTFGLFPPFVLVWIITLCIANGYFCEHVFSFLLAGYLGVELELFDFIINPQTYYHSGCTSSSFSHHHYCSVLSVWLWRSGGCGMLPP